MDKADLLDAIQDFKIKEREENIENDKEIIYLKEKVILFEEGKERNIKIRKAIKKENGDDPKP